MSFPDAQGAPGPSTDGMTRTFSERLSLHTMSLWIHGKAQGVHHRAGSLACNSLMCQSRDVTFMTCTANVMKLVSGFKSG